MIMRRYRPVITLLLGLTAAAALTWGLASAAPISARETPLASGGLPYEINLDPRGGLWISDSGANEIRQVHPPTGAYTVYSGLISASDARMDATGAVWWTNASTDNQLGRLVPASGEVTLWTLAADGMPWGTAVDAGGQVWITDFGTGHLRRFSPSTHELCSYALPGGGSADYVVAGNTGIWLGDSLEERLLRFEPGDGRFTIWQLAAGSYPEGLALAADGTPWWADLDRGELARLEPGTNSVTSFALPAGTAPGMVTLAGGKLWYTDGKGGMLGVLNPRVAAGTSHVVTRTAETVIPECHNLGDGLTSTVSPDTGDLAWATVTYTLTVDSGGWKIYQLPPGAFPWGIATAHAQVWAVDQERRQLLSLPIPETLEIAAGKSTNVAAVPETGGDVTFTFEVDNFSTSQAVTITSLLDSVYGPLAGDADCQVGTVLAADARCEFSLTRWVAGDFSGPDHSNVFTAHAEDGLQTDVSAGDAATVVFIDVLPDISAAKTANPVSLPETGGDVMFTFVVTNNGAEPVTIGYLSDSVYGALAGDDDCQVGTVLAAGAECTFGITRWVEGDSTGPDHINRFTAKAGDNEGNEDTATDDASVTFTSALPYHVFLPYVSR